jgi:hypothetical protein
MLRETLPGKAKPSYTLIAIYWTFIGLPPGKGRTLLFFFLNNKRRASIPSAQTLGAPLPWRMTGKFQEGSLNQACFVAGLPVVWFHKFYG